MCLKYSRQRKKEFCILQFDKFKFLIIYYPRTNSNSIDSWPHGIGLRLGTVSSSTPTPAWIINRSHPFNLANKRIQSWQRIFDRRQEATFNNQTRLRLTLNRPRMKEKKKEGAKKDIDPRRLLPTRIRRGRGWQGSLLFLAAVLFQDYELMKYSRLSAPTTRYGAATGERDG